MRLNDIPKGVHVYGAGNRGHCHREDMEMVTFFAKLRREYPTTYGALAIHPRNEQQLRGGQFRALTRHKAEGMTPGAADIIIPGWPAFVCELKRFDHTKSRWQPGQKEYLAAAADAGCFTCLAFGWEAAWRAFEDWRAHVEQE